MLCAPSDDVLLMLSEYANDFVGWLDADEPLVRAYTACILANIAFLEPGQQKVLDANGIPPLVRLLKGKEDKKVTLHSTAAVQNLTYKNTACCQEVIENGGEKALKKLLQHKSDDVQQFAAGALANLQLYRRKEDAEPGSGGAPSGGGRGSSMSRKVAKILRRKNQSNSDASPGGSGANVPQALQNLRNSQLDDAASTIQACYRGMKGRKDFERQRERSDRKKGNRYDVFRVNDVRAELAVLPPTGMGGRPGVLPGLGKLPGLSSGGGLGPPPGPGLSGFNAPNMRAPARLAPLGALGGPPQAGPGRLPGLLPPTGGGDLPGLPPAGGSGLRPAPPGLRLGAMR